MSFGLSFAETPGEDYRMLVEVAGYGSSSSGGMRHVGCARCNCSR
jgi:hypothetical protein